MSTIFLHIGSFHVNSTKSEICSRVTNFDLADFCIKYSMAFWQVIPKISTLYSHWLPRYEHFSSMGVGRFLTRLRNRATRSRVQALVSSLKNPLHQQKFHHIVNCTQIWQKCSQIVAICYTFWDRSHGTCSTNL